MYQRYISVPEGIRTPDPRLRRPLLYPAELRTHGFKRSGDGNRTHMSSLEGWCSTTELHPHDYMTFCHFNIIDVLRYKVEVTGFEPATPCSQSRCSSQAEPHLVIRRFSHNARTIISKPCKHVKHFLNTLFQILHLTYHPHPLRRMTEAFLPVEDRSKSPDLRQLIRDHIQPKVCEYDRT